jgi:7,8-dihydropterin-6-yl-methyl-4-(beta-D-ribofuranosyl)aminobenzene 5'-phosphate synthase
MTKDWGFSALVEVGGKRILFDTGNDGDIFAANVKAKGVDFKTLDFVVLSHRHSDHMAALNYVLSVNPTVRIYAPNEGFGIYGSSLPSSFYRKDETLPPEMRYYSGEPPQTTKFGAAVRSPCRVSSSIPEYGRHSGAALRPVSLFSHRICYFSGKTSVQPPIR